MKLADTGDDTVCLTDISVVSSGIGLPDYINAHAMMMVISWGFLIPLGVTVVKVLKNTSLMQYQIKDHTLVIVTHALCNSTGIVLTVSAGVLMVVKVGGLKDGLHAIFGTVVLFICILQCILGCVHYFTRKSFTLYAAHRFLGGILTYSALLNIFLGIKRVVDSGASRV